LTHLSLAVKLLPDQLGLLIRVCGYLRRLGHGVFTPFSTKYLQTASGLLAE
jgi:hypothetical protein